MAEGKNKIIVYADWINKFEALTDEEAGKLIKHFFRYVNDQNPEYPDRTTELMFIDIKCTLKRDLEAWNGFRKQQSEKGKKGGRPKKANESQKSHGFISKAKKAVTVTVTDTVKDSIKKKKVFTPPTLEEFMVYAKEECLTEAQYPHYRQALINKHKAWEANGWHNDYRNKQIEVWKTTLLNTINAWTNKK